MGLILNFNFFNLKTFLKASLKLGYRMCSMSFVDIDIHVTPQRLLNCKLTFQNNFFYKLNSNAGHNIMSKPAKNDEVHLISN